MISRVEFAELPPEESRQAWCAWLQHHTIDPDDVSVCPGFIEADSETRRIRYLAFDLDDQGRRYLDGEQAARSVRVVQLEARPSAFPEATEAAWTRTPGR